MIILLMRHSSAAPNPCPKLDILSRVDPLGRYRGSLLPGSFASGQSGFPLCMGRLGFLRLHHRSRLPDFLIMLSSLLKFFGLLPDNSGTPAVVASARKHKIWRDDEISRYSPFMQGLPVISPDRLLQTQSALIERIRQTVVSSQDVFDHHYYPVIQRYSAYVHLLPASQSHHHRGRAGGCSGTRSKWRSTPCSLRSGSCWISPCHQPGAGKWNPAGSWPCFSRPCVTMPVNR